MDMDDLWKQITSNGALLKGVVTIAVMWTLAFFAGLFGFLDNDNKDDQ